MRVYLFICLNSSDQESMDTSVVHIHRGGGPEGMCPWDGEGEAAAGGCTWATSAASYSSLDTFNGTWEGEADDAEPMSPIHLVIVAVYSLVFVVGLVGNCLVMYVIVRSVHFTIVRFNE